MHDFDKRHPWNKRVHRPFCLSLEFLGIKKIHILKSQAAIVPCLQATAATLGVK
jgi:hypothetical protein